MTRPSRTRAVVGGRPPRPSLRGGGGFWALRQPISRPLRTTLMAASAVVPLLAWLVLSGTGAVSQLFLPGPAAVARALADLVTTGELQADALATMQRVGIGFALAMVIAVPMGLAMGTFPSARALFEPVIGLLRYMPAPAFIPLLIIWLGLGEAPKIALLVIGTVFFQTLMSADVAAQVPAELIDASYTLGASKWSVVRKVILPHSVPGIIDAMRVNIAATFNLVVVAELVASQKGLGHRITQAQRFLHTDQIFAVLIVIGVIGVTIDLLFRLLRNLVAGWARP
jgi:NitT/TauT family transport system permease protein